MALLHMGKGSPKVRLWAVTLLTTEAPALTEERVRGVVAKVLSEELAAKLLPPVKSGPVTKFDVPTDKFFLSVESVQRPYPEKAALELMPTKILDLDVLGAFVKHRAFVAVEITPLPDTPRDAMYSVLGKLAAEFMDEKVVCVHCRDADVYALPDEEVLTVLRGEHRKLVLDYFMDRRAAGVDTGNVDMEAAMAEARRRLPEFLDVWKNSAAAGTFMVKGRFETEGRREYMWIMVSAIEGDRVTGKLGNRPLHARQLREGQQVTVAMEDVVDWAYATEGKGGGGFTDAMVRAAVGGP